MYKISTKFDLFCESIVNRKIEFLKDLTTDLVDDGYIVKIVNGRKGLYRIEDAHLREYYQKEKFILLYIAREDNRDLTDADNARFDSFHESLKKIQFENRGYSAGYNYRLYYFDKYGKMTNNYY